MQLKRVMHLRYDFENPIRMLSSDTILHFFVASYNIANTR
jgi:hypothetical protein